VLLEHGMSFRDETASAVGMVDAEVGDARAGAQAVVTTPTAHLRRAPPNGVMVLERIMIIGAPPSGASSRCEDMIPYVPLEYQRGFAIWGIVATHGSMLA
jgi:hypothetical protein